MPRHLDNTLTAGGARLAPPASPRHTPLPTDACIAHREEGLRDGQRRELYGIGPR